jgi:hypothetical protein
MLNLREGLWSVTNGTSLRPTTPIHQSTWDSKDQKPRAIIILSTKNIQKAHVKSLKTAREVWDALKNRFQA